MLIISILIDIVLNFVLIVKFLFFCYDKFIFLWRANFVSTASNPAEKQKGKKEGGLGEGIFALLLLPLIYGFPLENDILQKIYSPIIGYLSRPLNSAPF